MEFSGSKTKISRQLNLALTPKAARLMPNRAYPPGEHGPIRRRPTKLSDYKRQLLEKQRLRAQYNLSERQMRNYVRKAVRKKGNTADNLIQLLETRIDALISRAGFARTINAARQYISHRHIVVDGKWVNIPSQRIRLGETVSVKEKSRDLPCFVEAREEMVRATMPYLVRDPKTMSVKLLYLPSREEVVAISCEIPLVIEFYSR
jgi:small subunit ribosomal protein S4